MIDPDKTLIKTIRFETKFVFADLHSL